MLMPRQPKPIGKGRSIASDSGVAIGVSAFAFQGTNAHAIVSALTNAGSAIPEPHYAASGDVVYWQRKRVWVHPEMRAFVDRVEEVQLHQVSLDIPQEGGKKGIFLFPTLLTGKI